MKSFEIIFEKFVGIVKNLIGKNLCELQNVLCVKILGDYKKIMYKKLGKIKENRLCKKITVL